MILLDSGRLGSIFLPALSCFTFSTKSCTYAGKPAKFLFWKTTVGILGFYLATIEQIRSSGLSGYYLTKLYFLGQDRRTTIKMCL